jgi:hypothetical protein
LSPDDIDGHSVSTNFSFGESLETTINASYIIPPLDQSFTMSNKVKAGPSITELSGKWSEMEGFYELRLSETLRLNDYFSSTLSGGYNPSADEYTNVIGSLNLGKEDVKLESSLDYSIMDNNFSSVSSSLTFFDVSSSIRFDQHFRQVPDPDPANGWILEPNEKFQLKSISFNYRPEFQQSFFWFNRIVVRPELQLDWILDFSRFSSSRFTLEYGFAFTIHRYFSMKVSALSENNATFLYFPFFTEQIIGIEPLNPLEDLAKSVNFFSDADRESSNFNLVSLKIDAVHDLGDWDLILSYVGGPEEKIVGSARLIEWEQQLTITLSWKAIEEISRDFTIEEGTVSF